MRACATAIGPRHVGNLSDGAGEFGVIQAQIQSHGLGFINVASNSQVVWTTACRKMIFVMTLNPIDSEIVPQ